MNKIKSYFYLLSRSKLYLLAFIAIFAVLLTIFGIKGLSSRYAQDDYCYGYRIKTEGFWKAQLESYFQSTEYSSNRYSLTLLYGINEEIGGPKFIPFLPGLELISWAVALIFLILSLFKPARNVFITITATMCILFFTFYLSPNPYQNLYWLSAIHTYLTPVVLTTIMIGLILQKITSSASFTLVDGIELSLLGLLAGGFSEIATVWQFSLWVCSIIYLFFFYRETLFKKAKWPLITALISNLLAIIIMVINPTNSIRASHYQHSGLLGIITQSLFFGEEFIRVSLKATPLPFGIVFFFGFWLSSVNKTKSVLHFKKYIHILIITITMVYILCVTTMAPYLYAMGVYPGDRALFPAHFTLIAGLFICGWFLEKLILALWPKVESLKATQALLILIGIGLFAYMSRAIPLVYDNLPLFQARARAWDSRQQMILDAKNVGLTTITIPQFDSIYGITELKADPGNWINICAEKYYSVTSISAVDGYLGIPAYPIGK